MRGTWESTWMGCHWKGIKYSPVFSRIGFGACSAWFWLCLKILEEMNNGRVLSVQLRAVPRVLSQSSKECLPWWCPGWSSGLPDHLLFPQQSWGKGANFSLQFKNNFAKVQLVCLVVAHYSGTKGQIYMLCLLRSLVVTPETQRRLACAPSRPISKDNFCLEINF